MTSSTVLQRSLLDGASLCILLTIVVVGTLRWNAETWLHDYPPDIRRKFGPMSAEARKQRVVGGVLFLLAALTPLTYGLLQLIGADGTLGFGWTFLYIFTAATIFNVYDLLVLDWLLFVRIQPRFIILPGTEGMAGYRDYFFHLRAFLIGLAATGVFAAIVAAGVAIVE